MCPNHQYCVLQLLWSDTSGYVCGYIVFRFGIPFVLEPLFWLNLFRKGKSVFLLINGNHSVVICVYISFLRIFNTGCRNFQFHEIPTIFFHYAIISLVGSQCIRMISYPFGVPVILRLTFILHVIHMKQQFTITLIRQHWWGRHHLNKDQSPGVHWYICTLYTTMAHHDIYGHCLTFAKSHSQQPSYISGFSHVCRIYIYIYHQFVSAWYIVFGYSLWENN